MTQEKRFSDEFLNAFVDNQLASEEKSRAFVEISQDEGLNRQVCELRKMRDLVQHAYAEPPAPPTSRHGGRSRARMSLRFGIAASVVLVVGIAVGREIKLPAADIEPLVAHSATTVAASDQIPGHATPGAAANGPVAKQPRVLVHVTNDDPARLTQTLDDIESLLTYYHQAHEKAQIEVVLNGKGLDLVRSDTSKFAKRISQLQKNYKNLTFAACQNTIDRLKREHGIIVRLLPGVTVIDSGMAEIMRRQDQGWAYLQV
jgi:intracellular sulfur oxidation DsrE/DsrF family protein